MPQSHAEIVQMVISVMRDGRRLDRHLQIDDDGRYYTTPPRTYNGQGADPRPFLHIPEGFEVGEESEEECAEGLKLPVDTAAPAQETKTVLEPGLPAGRSLRVLIVEDNVDAADSLSMLLRLYGHDVQVARTGPSALQAAPGFRPEVVLLDIGLPGMDGYQVARSLREKPEFKDVTVCALTGYTPSEGDRQRQQESGFDHYYVKPVNLATLLEMFQTIAAPTF